MWVMSNLLQNLSKNASRLSILAIVITGGFNRMDIMTAQLDCSCLLSQLTSKQ